MSAEAFIDTNVLVYATQGGDPKAIVAIELLAAGGVVSVQVLNEFAHVMRRKFRRSWPEIVAVSTRLRRLCGVVRPVTIETHDAALRLVDCHDFNIYDALIVASALEAECVTLWSEDMQDGRVVDGRLAIRNPFASAARSRSARRSDRDAS